MDGEVLGQMVDAVGAGIGAYDSTGVYVYVNTAYADMLETDRESLIGTPIWEINEELDPDRFEEYWESYAEGETRRAEAVHRYGGTAVEVQTITTRLVVDGEAYNLGTIQDVSLLRMRERQLSQLHTVTKEIIDASSDTEIAQIVARTVEDTLGYENNVVRLVGDSGDLEPVAVTDDARTDVGDGWSYGLDEETDAVRAYRQQRPVVVDDAESLSDDYDRGRARSVLYLPIGPHGVLSIGHHEPEAFDETDVDLASILTSNAEAALRRLENERDLERQNERLEAFVDAISHDIPNHLNVATSRLELAKQEGELSHLSHVSRAHHRIESLISDMRTLVDHGDRIESTEWIRFEELVPNCWVSCGPETTNATLETVAEASVRADESGLKQMFENLFWNALEYAGDAPTIRVGLLEDGFYVADDGPGIPEEKREQVLAPGYTDAEGEKHSGFGLAIVREVARAHGWEIEIRESDAGGARFEITGVDVRSDDPEAEKPRPGGDGPEGTNPE